MQLKCLQSEKRILFLFFNIIVSTCRLNSVVNVTHLKLGKNVRKQMIERSNTYTCENFRAKEGILVKEINFAAHFLCANHDICTVRSSYHRKGQNPFYYLLTSQNEDEKPVFVLTFRRVITPKLSM